MVLYNILGTSSTRSLHILSKDCSVAYEMTVTPGYFFSKSADTVPISLQLVLILQSALCQSILVSGCAVQTGSVTKQEIR
eukprot:SAG11_NODE_231_length_11932_cov_40.992817_10_plen_80_part_00